MGDAGPAQAQFAGFQLCGGDSITPINLTSHMRLSRTVNQCESCTAIVLMITLEYASDGSVGRHCR